jgi:hypothetical protein
MPPPSPEISAGRFETPPLVFRSPARSMRMRLIGVALATGCTAVVVVAALLTPDPTGTGTHRQLGLPPCGFLMITGLPCPTCGMTTAVTEMVHGHPLRSLAAQPVGTVLALAVLAGVVIGAWMAASGRRLQVDWYRLSPIGLAVGLGAFFFLGWGVKIAIGLARGTLPYRY